MPLPFRVTSDYEPGGDQPKAIAELLAGFKAGKPMQVLARGDGHGQDVHGVAHHRGPEQADARARPQQDARGPALQGVQELLPAQRRVVLRQLLRLLPARGVHPAAGHLHRKRLVDQREHRPPATGRDGDISSAARTSSSCRRCRASTAWVRRAITSGWSCTSRRAKSSTATRCSSNSWTSSTNGTTSVVERGKFRVRGDTIEIWPSSEEVGYRIELFGDEIETLSVIHPVTGEVLQVARNDCTSTRPSTSSRRRNGRKRPIKGIEAELNERLEQFKKEGKLLEAERLKARVPVRPRHAPRGGLLLRHRELRPLVLRTANPANRRTR